MADVTVIDGTGAELLTHLERYPDDRFRLIRLAPDPSPAEPDVHAEDALSKAAAAIDAVAGRVPLRQPNRGSWLATVGMFENDPLIDGVDAASTDLRSRDFGNE